MKIFSACTNEKAVNLSVHRFYHCARCTSVLSLVYTSTTYIDRFRNHAVMLLLPDPVTSSAVDRWVSSVFRTLVKALCTNSSSKSHHAEAANFPFCTIDQRAKRSALRISIYVLGVTFLSHEHRHFNSHQNGP